MSFRYWIAAAVVAAVLIFLFVQIGRAAEDRGAWFRSLKQPGNGISCCDESDCRRTEAEWRDGQWWAIVPRYDGSAWEPIPPEKVLPAPHSIDGDAYVCNTGGGAGGTEYSSGTGVYEASPWKGSILCFVPPNMGF